MAKSRPIPPVDPHASPFVNAALIISAHLNALLSYERYLANPDEVYQLHQMRIAAKRLRYTMEIFEEIYTSYTSFGKSFLAAIEEVKMLQERLGAIHDADVLVPQLTAHLDSLIRPGCGSTRDKEPLVGVHLVDFDACLGLLTLCRKTQAERVKQYDQLLRHWRQIEERKVFEKLRALLRDTVAASLPTTEPPPSAELAAALTASTPVTEPASPEDNA